MLHFHLIFSLSVHFSSQGTQLPLITAPQEVTTTSHGSTTAKWTRMENNLIETCFFSHDHTS